MSFCFCEAPFKPALKAWPTHDPKMSSVKSLSFVLSCVPSALEYVAERSLRNSFVTFFLHPPLVFRGSRPTRGHKAPVARNEIENKKTSRVLTRIPKDALGAGAWSREKSESKGGVGLEVRVEKRSRSEETKPRFFWMNEPLLSLSNHCGGRGQRAKVRNRCGQNSGLSALNDHRNACHRSNSTEICISSLAYDHAIGVKLRQTLS